LFSTGFLLAVCGITNWLFAKGYGVPANAESANISALILALIITPITGYHDLIFLFWAGVLAMASKYIIAINHKHLLNPVAIAVAVTYFMVNQSASWWVGAAPMLPFVLLGGLLLVRKLRRSGLVLSFFFSAVTAIVVLSALAGQSPFTALQQTLLYSPMLFFAFVILTEPLTTPPTSGLRVVEGLLVGVLFAPQLHIGSFYITPEVAMLIGNVFAYLVSPKAAFVLQLKQKIRIAPDVYDFVFAAPRRFAFVPGQYMEWTLGHNDSDTRGNRRYFTLASSPTEKELRLGVKFYQGGSSYKQAMLAMKERTEIAATQLAGDFVLPQDGRQKCVLIAGGIGITPYRSMLKYLLDKGERRNLVLFYANRTVQDIVYKDVLDQARREMGVKTIYTVSDGRNLPQNWTGKVGRITAQMIKAEVPDYKDCMFYISGPQSLVDSMKAVLAQMHVPSNQIKTDLFAGLA
jgi:ferredoxin-NADP reductase